MRPLLPVLALGLAAGCRATPPGADDRPGDPPDTHDETDAGASETDPPGVETDPAPAETDAAETDTDSDHTGERPVDTDPADSEPPDTDEEPDETDPPPPLPVFGGAFVDVTGPLLGSHPLTVDPGSVTDGIEPTATGGFFVDLDGDGVDEVLVSAALNGGTDASTRVRVLSWTAAGLVPHDAATAAFAPLHDHVILADDLDGDGFVDLVLRRGDRGLVAGTGPLAFAEPTPVPLPPLYTGVFGSEGAAVPYDVDDDGLLDLVLGDNACGGTSRSLFVLLSEGPHRWANHPELLPGDRDVAPWTVLAARDAAGEVVLGAIGQTCDALEAHPGFVRFASRDFHGYPRFTRFDPFPADALFRQLTIGAGGPITLQDPMGASLADHDGDGVLDLTISGSTALFLTFRGFGTWPLVEASWTPPLPYPTRAAPWFQWGVVPLDLDLDGRTDLVYAHGDDTTTFLQQRIGPQSLLAMWNDGHGGFVDVTDRVGLSTLGSWRALTAGDPDEDGDVDLVAGGNGRVPAIWRNDLAPAGRHGLTIRLHGAGGNPRATGSLVELVDADAPRQVAAVPSSFSPMVVAPPLVAFGLGEDLVADLVRVTWPSGFVQTLTGLAGDARHDLVEPEVIAVTPASRRVPADGTSAATVRVIPRAPDGTPRAATVTVRVAYGLPAAVEPVVCDATGCTARIVAPTTAGASVLEAAIDGVPVRIRPRIWWE